MSRRLRIAQVSPLYERVPPALYGGTERVVGYLTEELVERGHQVTLFATADSRTKAKLVALAPRALRLDASPRDDLAFHLLELARVFERPRDFDVIHCHVGHLAFPFSRLAGAPSLHTMHGRLDMPDTYPVFRHFRDQPLVSISHAQRRPFKRLGVSWIATVYHGIPVEGYPFSPKAGSYLAFLGRISPEKRPDLAIALAKRVGIPLKMAAKVDPVDQVYFDRDIKPLLDHPLIEFIGEIGETAKPAFLGQALALVFPIDWPEPFGLVMIESLACGTPVIARACGSVPELILDGRTGFIADTLEDMEAAVKALDRIDRTECRRDVLARFTVGRMVDHYEEVYGSLVTGQARSA
ncbi:MAG TPA: glycosyltransferase family 4 protein [Candidatus Bathyarchaeia archaeon]|nr:glycosyltransferase family 4 protein [Candidatus Bathyarchaeia archaeon]